MNAIDNARMDAASMVRYVSAPTLGDLISEHGDSKLVDLLFTALRDCDEPLPENVAQAFNDLIAGVTECLAKDLASYTEAA